MDDWGNLHRELDRWQAAGLSASFWWRDDDATEPTAALDRLLTLGAERQIAPCLAVIPAPAGEPLAARLADAGPVRVVQHGYAHRDHAPAGEKKSELGAGRPLADRLRELKAGRRRLAHLFGRRLLAVLVPPWNRIEPGLVSRLPEAGYRGLSTIGARQQARPAAGLIQVNVHCDPIDWRNGRTFVGTAPALERVIAHLRARRAGRADPAEPTGLLTHHLAMDADGWRFAARLLSETAAHPGVRWLGPEETFRASCAAVEIGIDR